MRNIILASIVLVLSASTLMLQGCAPTYVRQEKDSYGRDVYVVRDTLTGAPYSVTPIPEVHRPVDWDHLLLSERAKDRITYKDKIIFIADVGTGRYEERALFFADSDGKNLREFRENNERISLRGLKQLGTGERLLGLEIKKTGLYYQLLLIDVQTEKVIHKITLNNDDFCLSPDEHKIAFLDDHSIHEFEIKVFEMEADFTPKNITKIFQFRGSCTHHGDCESYVSHTLGWTEEGIVFGTNVEDTRIWDVLKGARMIRRTYCINPDGTNLRKIKEEERFE